MYKIDQSLGRHRQEQNKRSVAGIIVLDLTTERVRGKYRNILMK